MGLLAALRRSAFHLNENFLRMKTEVKRVLRNTNNRETLLYHFLLLLLPCIRQPFNVENDDTEGKGKIG